MRLSPKTVAVLLRELRGTGMVDHKRLRQCESLRAALEQATRPDNALPFPMALAALYPNGAPESSMVRFRIWRSRLNQRLADAGATFRLAVSQNRRLSLEERLFWFEGEDRTVATFNEFSNAEARLDRPVEPARGRPRTVIYVVSYAHNDRAAVESLLKRLHLRLSRIGDFRFEPWRDIDNMVPGENIPDEVDEAIGKCSMGLQMVSYEYMSSEFIREHERPRFAAGKTFTSDSSLRVGFPIALDRPDFENSDWEEFGRNQRGLFLHDGKAYQDLREGDHELRERNRDAFADACVRKIVQAARRYLGGHDDDPPPSERLTDEALREAVSSGLAEDYVTAHGHETRMLPTYRFETGDAEPTTPGIPVLDHLVHWAIIRRSTPLFALLGEYGMGKTINCKQLTLALLERRRQTETNGASPPMPVYLDMRYARGLFRSEAPQQGSRRFEHLEIDDLVNSIFRESWKARETPDAADLRRLIAGGNVLIVFDGFDEVAAHLHPDEAQSLIRTMWSLLPPDALSPDVERRPKGAAAVQMLISCRTHYFRDFTQEANLFTGHQRDLDRGADLYDAMTLLPFTERQIERFLAANLGDEGKARRALDTIRSVHDLPELARRPVLLDRICGQLERIEALAAMGERINAARLYDLFTDEWLARDNAKHTFDVEIKKTLMARLASAMWRSGERVWRAGKVEAWLDGELRGDPRLRERYAELYRGKAREILYEDLRTSTFVVRSDGDGFRFAHTSILEYFLAKHLFQTLRDGDANAWEDTDPSPECLDFLAEIACENAREVEKRHFFDELGKLLRHAYRRGVSEVAFRIALEAQRRGETAAPRGRYRLEGAKLAGWEIVRRDCDPPVDLSGSDFTGATLKCVHFADLVARDCVFDGAVLEFACFERVDLSGNSFERVRAHACVFRQCRMRNMQDGDATWRKTTFVHCRDLQDLKGSDEGSGGPLVVPGDDFTVLGTDCGSPRLEAQLSSHCSAGDCAFSSDGTRVLDRGYGHTLRLWDMETGEKIAVLQDHTALVLTLALSPDGTRIVSGSDDGTLRLWDGDTGETIAVLDGHTGRVETCSVSPGGTRIVSGSDDGTLRLWDGDTGETIAVLDGHTGRVETCSVSPDGTRIVSGSDDGTLRLWDGDTGEAITVLDGHTGRVETCSFSPDGTRIVSASDDGTLRLWDGDTGETIAVLKGHTGRVKTFAFSPDGTRIVSGSDDSTLRLWDGDTGDELAVLQGHSNGVSTCAFSPDGTRIVSASDDDKLRLWDGDTGETIAVLKGHTGRVKTIAFSPDGTRIVSGGAYALRLWDVDTGEEIVVFQSRTGWVSTLAFSPDGTLMVSGSRHSTLYLWDMETGKQLAVLQGHSGGISTCAFSPDGTRIVSGSDDSTLRLWDGETGEEVAVLQGHPRGVSTCAFSPDGRRVVSAALRGKLCLWDVETGEELPVLQGHIRVDSTCAFSPDGRRFVSGGTDRPRLWNLETGEEIAVLQGHTAWISTCAFSPDGTRVISGSSDALRLWDGETGEAIAVLLGHTGGVSTCAFSPDGTRVVSGGHDSTLRLWDAETGEAIAVLQGHTVGVRACAFSPDGTRVVSGSDDNTLRLWDVETGEAIAVLQGHTGGVLTCAFSPDGTRVVSGSNDSTLRLWDAVTGKAMAVFYHLPDGGHLVYSARDKRVIGASGDAWQYFRWFVPNRRPYPLLPLEADPRIGAIPTNGYRALATELWIR